MLDIQYIRDHKDEIAKAAEAKHIVLDVNELLAVDKERVRLLQELEELYSLKRKLMTLDHATVANTLGIVQPVRAKSRPAYRMMSGGGE